MNERIKELWSQAGGHYNSGNQHTWPEYTITDPEKFAELIVRECAELASQCAEWAVQNPEDHILQRFGLYETPAQVKKQFEVEE